MFATMNSVNVLETTVNKKKWLMIGIECSIEREGKSLLFLQSHELFIEIAYYVQNAY